MALSDRADEQSLPAALRERGKPLHCEVGETVFRSGTSTHSVFYVETGAVRLVRYGRAGEEVVLHDARAGEFFAEASLDSARYHCGAVVSQAIELLQFPATALRQLLDADREFARQWVSLMARRLRTVRTRVERLSLKSASERVQHLLVSEGRGPRCEVKIQGTFKDLAHRLGLTHEALYRTLAALEREGVIQRDGMALRLLG